MITIRNIPEDLYKSLVSLAAKQRRSLQQQALLLLEAAKTLNNRSPLREALVIRERLAGRKLGDCVAEVREDRSR